MVPVAVPEPVAAGPDPDRALRRGVTRLLHLQHPDGWWKGELETNVTMDAEDLLLREFLGIRQTQPTGRAALWIRSQQNADGSWSNFRGGPGDLSTSVEAWVALRLAGDDPRAEHMRRAAAWVRDRGGVQRARVFTHIWLALFGAWSWDNLPNLPVEQILLPAWFPLNVYDFACWARQTVVALSVVLAHRPVRPLGFSIDALGGDAPWSPPSAPTVAGRALVAVDRALGVYGRRPVGRLRRRALARAERWIVDRQEADGCWGGIQPPWVYSLIALHLRGYPLDHPVIARGLAGLERFVIDDEAGRRLEACQSPVWDTALAVIALRDAGLGPEHEAVARAADWLAGEQIRGRGDWAVRRPEVAPGGWAFEFANANYPDIDDTAEILIALRGTGHDEAVERGREWMAGMQSSDGGWGAFDADNTRSLIRDLPFCDFGEVIDPPSADVTAHVVEALALLGQADTPAARSGLRWLLEAQESDGSWFGRWGVNHIYGTGAAVPALIAAGIPRSDPRVRRAVRWLETHQNADGGWGEDCRSYDDPAFIGHGPSTASQTAWALLALHAAGESSRAIRRGLDWLARSQNPDGTWDEPQYTGTGFPSDFYINYHLYRQVFPVMALGRCLRPVAPWSPRPADIMAQASAENFPVASALVGRRRQAHLRAVYGFARLVDNLGDEAVGDRAALLDEVDAGLDVIFSGGEPDHPILRALAATVRECGLPPGPLRRLVQANRADQVVTRYETFDDLLDYCRLSAAPVGELVLGVFGAATPERIRLSDAICAGLQVTEHLQDVAEDHARGRVYLPLADMRLVGCDEADLTGASAGPALRALLALEVGRARALLAEGAPLVPQLPLPARLAVTGFLAGGRAALHALERADYDVLSGDPRPGRRELAAELAPAWWGR